MASTLIYSGTDRRRVFRKILLSLGFRNLGELYQHCFYSSGGAPTYTGTKAVKTGSLVLDLTNNKPYIVTSGHKAGSATAIVFKKIVT